MALQARPPSVAQRHAEWAGLLRADGPFIAIPVLTEAFPQGLDTVPDDTLDKLRLAWAEVREAPDLLTPAWDELVLGELLGYTPAMLAEGGALPADLRTGPSRAAGCAPTRSPTARTARAAGPSGCWSTGCPTGRELTDGVQERAIRRPSRPRSYAATAAPRWPC